MTAIVVYRTKTNIYAVSDKRHNVGYGPYYDNAKKYFCGGGHYIYFAGATVARAAIEEAFKAVVPEDLMLEAFLSTFTRTARALLPVHGVSGDDEFHLIYINNRGDIVFFNEKLDPTIIPTMCINIGSAGDYAEGYVLGRLSTLINPNDETIMATMHAAIKRSAERFRNVSPTCDFLIVNIAEQPCATQS